MKLFDRLRRAFSQAERETEPELLPGNHEDPFTEPVVIEIRDVIDLHSIPPKQVKAVVEEYLVVAHEHGFRHVRIIHGKGIGAQRTTVRTILARTPWVLSYRDAPPQAGGWGATIAELLVNENPKKETDRS